jgi:DNA modification methylase
MSIFTGDAYKLIRKIPDERIHCVVTSPPYWGLRDYGVNGQMGLEASPEHYVRKMVLLFREIRRALKSDGSVWLNIGDSYWGSNKGAGQKDFSKSAKQARNPGSLANTPTTSRRHAFLKPKDLIGLPWRVALALQEDGWWLRQDNIWHKKNPMTESVLDRTTRSHEYIFHLTKSPDYYYNYIAVQEDCVSNERDIARMKAPPTKKSKYTGIDDHRLAGAGSKIKHQAVVGNGVKRNRRTVWTLPTSNFRGYHDAVMPESLVEPCILAGCPKGGVVLDPFAGAGTTGVVAQRLGRKFIGFELNPEYADLARSRLKSDAHD